ncbi:hypothetical protein [Rhizobium tubonense]|uniref:Uncharacterized protein n=1 Tax=Rhizobium tubonense TaxID=484088 RepID=A0A2W4DKJ6_9HYPH|nr:hypothetical protein [Rhizobium tubonense]PZM16694.1 hypothetical protein CPY51_00055 [Rhizobium tubonense]
MHRRKQRYISQAALEQFKTDYVTLRNYAIGRGNIARVKEALTALGITPVFEEPGAAAIYRVGDVPPDLKIKK